MNTLPKSYVWFRRVFWATFFILSLCFVVTDWDLKIQSWIFYKGDESWALGEGVFWKLLYYAAPYASVILTLVALVTWIAGVGRPKLSRLRKLSAYWVCSMGVGPGLITNLILKDHWGRPRPRMLAEFGGDFVFEPLLHIDLSSYGKSFPCGHATIGFVFFSLGVLLWRADKPWGKRAGYFALIFGLLIGVARMLQGGHFASDVIWAAAVCWLTAEGLHRAFRLDKSWWFEGEVNQKRTWVGLLAAPAVALMICLAMLATPRKGDGSGSFAVDSQQLSKGLVIVAPEGVELQRFEGELRYEFSYQGHGWPKSKYGLSPKIHSEEGKAMMITFEDSLKGLFIEKTASLTIWCPESVQIVYPGE